MANSVALADFLLFSFDNILESQINKKSKMDAIRKKMKSIKDETDQLYGIINKFSKATEEAESIAKEVSCVLLKIMLCRRVSISQPSTSQSA